VSTKTMSHDRFNKFAVVAKIRSAMPGSDPSRKSIAAYAASSSKAGQPSMATRSAAQRTAASFEPGSRHRWATNAKHTRSTSSPSRRRPSAAEPRASPIPRRSHNRSNTYAPPNGLESTISTSDPTPVPAPPVSRTRLIDRTSRASASRSTLSARPKLWITFATGEPVSGCRSLCANCR
jgi:hypothetical protein